MSFRILFMLISIFSFIACQTTAPAQEKFSVEELAEQDQAWAKMMEGHDRAMPMMTPLSQVASQIEDIAEQNQAAANDIHPKAMDYIERMEAASDEMMDWMAGISDNPLDSLRARYADHAAVMAAIDKETSAIEKVEELMNSALGDGKQFVYQLGTPQPE